MVGIPAPSNPQDQQITAGAVYADGTQPVGPNGVNPYVGGVEKPGDPPPSLTNGADRVAAPAHEGEHANGDLEQGVHESPPARREPPAYPLYGAGAPAGGGAEPQQPAVYAMDANDSEFGSSARIEDNRA